MFTRRGVHPVRLQLDLKTRQVPPAPLPSPGRASFLVMRDVGMYCFALCIPDDSPPHRTTTSHTSVSKTCVLLGSSCFFFFFTRGISTLTRPEEKNLGVAAGNKICTFEICTQGGLEEENYKEKSGHMLEARGELGDENIAWQLGLN